MPADAASRATFGLSSRPKSPGPTPDEVARSHGDTEPDSVDILLARVLNSDFESLEFEGGSLRSYWFSGEMDSAFQILTRLPQAMPRLVDCLGWNRLARTTWQGSQVLVGAVCGHALNASTYSVERDRSNKWPANFREHGPDHRLPTIEKLRTLQKLWRKQLMDDPA